MRVRTNHLVAAGLAAAVVAGGAVIASSAEDPVTPVKPNAPGSSIIFGDPPVVKGARGGKTDVVTLPVSKDPTVRKGAGSGDPRSAHRRRVPGVERRSRNAD